MNSPAARFSPLPAALRIALLAAAATLAYLPVFFAGYVWDDLGSQGDTNPVLTSFRAIWLTPHLNPWEGHYWPATYSSFRMEIILWGGGPAGSHAVNLLLHILNSMILGGLLRKLRVPGAELAAMLFALHPVHVESVAWIIERKDVLSAFFYLAAARLWLDSPPRRGAARTAAATVCYILGLLSKSIVVTLPAALFVIEFARRPKDVITWMKSLVPMFLAGLVITACDLRFNAWREQDFTIDITLSERILLVARAFWFYAGKLAVPATLTTVYPKWDMAGAGAGAGIALFLMLLLLLTLAAGTLRARGEPARMTSAALLCYPLTLLPILGLVNFGFMSMSFAADRYQYLASAFPIAAAAAGAEILLTRLRANPGFGRAGAGGVLLFAAMLTCRHAALWKNDETLFLQNVRVNPESGAAWLSLGLYAAGEADDATAEKRYRRCLEIDPGHPEAWNNLGTVLHRRGDNNGAIASFARAVASRPDYPSAWMNMGLVLESVGRIGEAAEAYTRALNLDPNLHVIRNNLEELLAKHPEIVMRRDNPATTVGGQTNGDQ